MTETPIPQSLLDMPSAERMTLTIDEIEARITGDAPLLGDRTAPSRVKPWVDLAAAEKEFMR